MRARRVDQILLCHSREGGNPDRSLATRSTATFSSLSQAAWVPAFAGTTAWVETGTAGRDFRSAL